MGDLLRDGLSWLEAQRRTHLCRPVLYRRGESTVEVDATVGATKYETDESYGLVVEGEVRDYLIAREELIFGGEEVLPEEGDRIEEDIGGTTHLFEVQTFGTDGCYRFTDPGRRTLRVHTRYIEARP